jgi:cobalamin synthase
MKDSRVGTYALVAMVITIYTKLHAIAALPDHLILQVWLHIVSPQLRNSCLGFMYRVIYKPSSSDIIRLTWS